MAQQLDADTRKANARLAWLLAFFALGIFVSFIYLAVAP